jgi:peptidoglycan LD-endopeptidase CwlK
MKTFHPSQLTTDQKYIELGAAPELAARLHDFALHAAARNVEYCITCIWRSNDAQAALYAQGRTTPGNIVTNAKPGTSRHNESAAGWPAATAADMCPVIDGKPSWSKTGATLAAWQKMGDIAEQVGLEWARNVPAMMHDWPHFQLYRAPRKPKGA